MYPGVDTCTYKFICIYKNIHNFEKLSWSIDKTALKVHKEGRCNLGIRCIAFSMSELLAVLCSYISQPTYMTPRSVNGDGDICAKHCCSVRSEPEHDGLEAVIN